VLPVICIVTFAGLLIVVAVMSHIAARKRREAMAQLALRLGLNYRADRDQDLARQLEFLNQLARGENRYAYNVLSGHYQGHEVRVFDYHYETHSRDSKGRRQTTHHNFSFFVLLLPRGFPELRIMHEGFLSKIAQAFGYDDIDFESAEFSKAFCARSKDKRFAYDFCHGQMMEYLLANRDLNLEVESNVLALAFTSRLSMEGIERNLGRLLEIRSRLPEYLLTKVSAG